MKTIKMCGVLLHYPYEPYPQQISISQVAIRAFTRLQNGAVEIPTGCGKTMALLCSALGFQVDQRYKLLGLINNDDSLWETTISSDASQIDLSITHDVHGEHAANDVTSACQVIGNTNIVTNIECDALSTADSTKRPGKPVLDDDNSDDDFLPRRQFRHELKKPRRDCGDSACSVSPCTGGVCGSKDIEDQPIPTPDNVKSSSRSPLGGETTRAIPDSGVHGGGDGGREDFVDLVSESGSSSGDSCEGSPLFTPCTQEVLDTSRFIGSDDGGVGWQWQTITREAVRSALDSRTRQPVLGGEFGPIRNLTLPRSSAPLKIPKIFYTSRTHLQLEQVANEIKQTAYRDARVVVLSSREFYCINDKSFNPKKYSNRTEMCRELLNDIPVSSSKFENVPLVDISSKVSCSLYKNKKQYTSHTVMESINVGPVIDMNSLVTAGRRHQFCPYFTARNLIASADIVLCPVNYLIDPIIRKSMRIELKGEIVIMDEAHMLDDMCRETASLLVGMSDLQECFKNCSTLVDNGMYPTAHRPIACVLKALMHWIETNSNKSLSFGFCKEREFSLSGTRLLASFEQSNINQEVISKFSEGLSDALKYKTDILTEESKSSAFFKVISNKTASICERLEMVMKLVIEHSIDYIGSVSLTSNYDSETFSQSSKEKEWCIKLVCQNAGLIFQSLSSTRSIVFSSATISPLPAFAAELGVEIQNTAVRGHVIPSSQTWIGCLGKGENGRDLYGIYNNAKTSEYMDAIGSTVLDICCRVPFGVLVFVTSYWTLENIVQRWKDTGLWSKIAEHKRPFSETRRSKDFNEVLKCFYSTVEIAQQALSGGLVSLGEGCTGPLLIAVMRGKVSEGFNFSDDKTRAIITVGIPYPNIHEDTIRWKKEYNKTHSLTRPLQDAEGWYNTQAFTALSQSLGRGLRHRKDWCLLLLIDARFQQEKYSHMLPQWMYQRMVHYREYSGMLGSVDNYIKRMEILCKNDSSL